MGKRTENGPGSRSALDELLVVEREIAARHSEVTREAERLLAEAQAAVAMSEREAQAQLESELADRAQSAAVAREVLIKSMEDEATAVAARYRALTDDEITRLAEDLARRVTGLEMPAREPAR